MSNTVADTLDALVRTTTPVLRALAPERARRKPDADTWSPQELVGHLIDSAANNHQRFIRAQEPGPLVFPNYEQEHWVEVQGYNDLDWSDLVDLWAAYNRHLAAVIRRIPEAKLDTECRIGPYEPVTLGFLVEDYVAHLRHHLHQIAERSRAGG